MARLCHSSIGPLAGSSGSRSRRLPHFDQSSLSTYNGISVVTLEGVIDADPDVRDTYINLYVNAERLMLPDKSSARLRASCSFVRRGPPNFAIVIVCE